MLNSEYLHQIKFVCFFNFFLFSCCECEFEVSNCTQIVLASYFSILEYAFFILMIKSTRAATTK